MEPAAFEPPVRGGALAAVLLSATTASSAFLLFVVEPMIGRLTLPALGGAPAVWTACMLFFQLALLGGYLYAHLLLARLPLRAAIALHAGLLVGSLALLPVTPDTATVSASGHPALAVVVLLARSVGGPFLLLSATAPLVQAWAARTAAVRRPYALYAWSNAGSLLALAAYPVVFEPRLGLAAQSRAWSLGYGAIAAAIALTGAFVWRRAGAQATSAGITRGAPPPVVERVAWVGLSALGSALLLAITEAMSEDITAAPFVWVLPLALYLVSFIVAFGRPAWADRRVWLPLFFPAACFVAWALQKDEQSLVVQLASFSAAALVFFMVAHGELVRLRPGTERLTGYYLAISVGGAVGGGAVSILAPLLLPVRLELPIAIVCAGACSSALWLRERKRAGRPLSPAIAAALLVLLVSPAEALRRASFSAIAGSQWSQRSFFGLLTVWQSPDGSWRKLNHGRIVHGRQSLDDDESEPLSYYAPRSGVGLYFRFAESRPPRRVAAVGLGVGTLAAYGRPGDLVRFFELDPGVELAARRFFTFLPKSRARTEVVLGDARLSLAHERDEAPYDLIVLDAFTGDAIPAHLLTREAFALYQRRLTPRGVIAVHVSNRHLDLGPVVRAHAVAGGLSFSTVVSPGDLDSGINRARWLLLTEDPDLPRWLRGLGLSADKESEETLLWTDDLAPLLPTLRVLR